MGRKLGISDDEIENIRRLVKDDFDHREYVALTYARDFAALGGKEPEIDTVAEFQRLYPENERKYIISVAAKMDFINRLMGIFSREKF